MDDVKKRKLAEEKMITDFISERESFLNKQQRGKEPQAESS